MTVRRGKQALAAGLLLLAGGTTAAQNGSTPTPRPFQPIPAPAGSPYHSVSTSAEPPQAPPVVAGYPASNAQHGSIPCDHGGMAVGPARSHRGTFGQQWKTNLQVKCVGFRGEFVAPPLGATINAHFQTQVNNGTAHRMMLYDFDFACGTAVLNERGRDRVAEIAGLLSATPFPVVVARTPDAPALAEARRLAVLQELASSAGPLPPERVLIGPAMSRPLHGVEAVLLIQNLLRQVQSVGASPGTGAQGQGFDPGGGFSPGGGGSR